MVSEWMTNGNIAEYIKRNDCQRMQLVRENPHDGVCELTNPVAYRLCKGGAISSWRESRARGPQGCMSPPKNPIA